jgi:hypothetical protein
MALTGPPPKENKIGRSPTAEWTEVENTPNLEGLSRELPDREWHRDTLTWWAAVRVLPHSRLWQETDWTFAADTAIIKDLFYNGRARSGEMVEMRHREDLMGVSREARRKLRIRYVAPRIETSAIEERGDEAAIVNIADRRRRLTEE